MKTVKKTKRYPVNPPRWSHDPNKVVTYEFTFRKKIVVPGMTITLKGDRTKYQFVCLVFDTKLESTWIELMSECGSRSVRLERVSNVLTTTKRSRAKKID